MFLEKIIIFELLYMQCVDRRKYIRVQQKKTFHLLQFNVQIKYAQTQGRMQTLVFILVIKMSMS